MLTLSALLTQTADATQIVLTDTTGSYSVGNPGGWGSPNPETSLIQSIYVSGTIQQAPATTPPIVISSTELMPSPFAFPYLIPQAYILTPTLLSLTDTTFPDGIYNLTYTVNIATEYTINDTIAFSAYYSIGDPITDTTTGKAIGNILTVGIGTIVISPCTGYIVSVGDSITNGTHVFVLTSSLSATFTTQAYTVTIQALLTPNADAGLANILAGLEPCGCSCSDIDILFDNFMTLMAAKAASGNYMNNKALDDLTVVQNYLTQQGCPCNSN